MHARPFVRLFAPDPRHHGVRPVQIWPLLAAVVPWGYAWRTYFAWPWRRTEAHATPGNP